MTITKFEKSFVALKYYLIGKKYYQSLKALQFARTYHSGVRKDLVTPEFAHQIEICLYLTSLPNLNEQEDNVLTVALLHDVMEDYDISKEEMIDKFGQEVTNLVWLLTKKYKGTKKTPEQYFEDISNSRVASIVKGADRIHNVQSMIKVFSKEKQKQYLEEVETYFLPMIKKAKYNFPEQTATYFNIQHMLKSQMYLIKAMLNETKE